MKNQYLLLLFLTSVAVGVIGIAFIGVIAPIKAETYNITNTEVKRLESPSIDDKRGL